MATILEARAIISGEDKTGPAFDSFEKKTASLAKSAATFNKVSGAIAKMNESAASVNMIKKMSDAEGWANRLASNRMIDGLTRFANQASDTEKKVTLLARAIESAGKIKAHMGPLVEGAVGVGAFHATREALRSGAELESQRVNMRVAGIPQAEIAAAENQSYELAARLPNITPAEAMETYKEARSVLLKPEETPGMMPTIIAAKAAMKASGADQDQVAGLQFAIKGAEILGRAQNPKEFKTYMDSFVRQQQVMGKTISPEQMYDFAKYVKASGVLLSDRFLATTGASLSQEMGGSTAGKSTDQFVKQLIGGFQGQQHAAAKEFVRLGLAKKDDFETTRSGEIKGMKGGHKVAGADLARSDPDLWVKKYLLPALATHGYTNLADQISEVRRLFPAGTAADLVSKMIQQAPSYANHAELYANAAGIDGALTALTDDPRAALAGLETSLESFGATLTSPIMTDAAHVMSSMAMTIGAWAKSLHEFDTAHPGWGKAIGGASIVGGVGVGALGTYGFVSGMMNGFGLKGSAAALDGAAASLDAAAARIGAGGAVSAAESAGGGAAAVRGLGFMSLFATNIAAPIALAMLPDPVEESKAAAEANLKRDPHALDKLQDDSDIGFGSDIKRLFGSIESFFSHQDKVTDPASIGEISKSVADGILGGKAQEMKGDLSVAAKIELSADAARFFKLMQDVQFSSSDNLTLRRANTGTSMPEAAPRRGRL